MTDHDVTQLQAGRQAEGRRIDPENVEFCWCWTETLDPYGDGGLPEELSGIGREYFVRTPGGSWINFRDLPRATLDRVRARIDGCSLAEGCPCCGR
jgi:hypothetical protein